MTKNYLERLKRIAKNHNPTAQVTYSKRHGYFVTLRGRELPLGKDAVEALFRLEKLLKEDTQNHAQRPPLAETG
jgi:hypothetical protein